MRRRTMMDVDEVLDEDEIGDADEESTSAAVLIIDIVLEEPDQLS